MVPATVMESAIHFQPTT